MADNKLSIHNIVCPTDFSDFAASAFEESVRLARWFGAKVTAVHITPFALPIAGEMGYIPIPAETVAAAHEAMLAKLQHFVDQTDHLGVSIGIECRQGDACTEIRELVEKLNADLVVMGTHGRSGFKRLVLGSVTEELLNHPPAPILTVHRNLPKREGLYRTVLCATEMSEGNAATIAAAMAIADEGAKRLMILNVIEHPMDSTSGGAVERAALAALRAMIPEEARNSYAIVEHVTFGQSDREILDSAAVDRSDLIVMGTQGGGALAHAFGSTVRGVVRDSITPVLIVPAGHVWPATGLVRTQAKSAQRDRVPKSAIKP